MRITTVAIASSILMGCQGHGLQEGTTRPDIEEVVHFSVSGLVGTSLEYSCQRESWSGVMLNESPTGPDPLGNALRAATEGALTLHRTPQFVSDVAATTAAEWGADLNRDWLEEKVTLHVKRHGPRKLVRRVFSAEPPSYALFEGDVVLYGGPDAAGIRMLDADDRASDFCLAEDVLGLFPEEPESASAHGLGESEWSFESAHVKGRKRLRMVSLNGIGGEPGAVRTLVFEENFGRMVPVMVQDSYTESTVVKDVAWGPAWLSDDTLTAFPTLVTTVGHADDVAWVTRDTLSYLGTGGGLSGVKFPAPTGSVLMVNLAVLDENEKSGLVIDDASTWPVRVLDLIEFQ